MTEIDRIQMTSSLMSLKGAKVTPCIDISCALFKDGAGCTSESELIAGPENVDCPEGKGTIRVRPQPAEVILSPEGESNLV